jgi:hypothetical protein
MNERYPLTYSVDYPDRDLDRLTTFFRLFTVIPIAIVLGAVSHVAYGGWDSYGTTYITAGGVLFAGPLLMILFRKKYPRWWFDWNRELLRFTQRVYAYGALMSDVYPSTDEQQYVHLEIDYPNAETDLARGMPLVKWFLAIPHYFLLIFLYIAAFFVVIFDFVMGVERWALRVIAYAFILVTDKYPPFSLDEEQRPTAPPTV